MILKDLLNYLTDRIALERIYSIQQRQQKKAMYNVEANFNALHWFL